MSYFARSDELPAWVGDLPDDWKRDWLKWSVRLSTERPTEEEQAQLPYISNEDIASWTGKLMNDQPRPAESDGRKFQVDDVLLNKLRPYLAKVYHADFDGVSSGELLCLRPSNIVLPRFLFYVLVSKGFIDSIDAETFGSKMPRADWEIVGHQPLPLPSLETQRRIAQFLDEKTARIDGLIEKKRALLDRLAEKRQALITRAVTKGLNPNSPMKPSGIDWLGDIPAHWELAPLRWYTRTASGEGIRNEDLSAHRDESASIPVIGGNGLMGYTYESNSLDASLVVGRVGALCGNVHLISEPSWITDNALKIYGVRKYESSYLLHALRVRDLNTLATRNAQPLMTGEVVRAQVMPMPPVQEQHATATFINRESAKLERQCGLIEQSVARLDEYRSALITAAVTGQVGGVA